MKEVGEIERSWLVGDIREDFLEGVFSVLFIFFFYRDGVEEFFFSFK